MATVVNGRFPEAEVIVTFGDGWSYSKTKMELFRAAGGFDKLKENQPAKAAAPSVVPKKEDVKKLMAEMEIPKSLAESTLVAANGDLKRAYELLIYGDS
ncbi:SubName: Full=Uncharacterized protein {ECO:0000313/EMBL:CCA77991.1} [Serendipita indica DSM 11827]|uniref:Nascent polypeptide-associated complex subunit alpha-like UBA domain-containing protein n=1 Tax=Serendipita indica (strain DSM 11827) TaxID=1109443 RepID=G4U320_SERID|nr:SubName: Full=Uncharacterized protein {ECO:0000313/EMBL:CCA77991.1} [Serendipita indica DSM 11827]CCA77991.1 hypothetical protein PIIN_00705 [Serendipita indica DSM 11827]